MVRLSFKLTPSNRISNPFIFSIHSKIHFASKIGKVMIHFPSKIVKVIILNNIVVNSKLLNCEYTNIYSVTPIKINFFPF